jgi:hypothetical protein
MAATSGSPAPSPTVSLTPGIAEESDFIAACEAHDSMAEVIDEGEMARVLALARIEEAGAEYPCACLLLAPCIP